MTENGRHTRIPEDEILRDLPTDIKRRVLRCNCCTDTHICDNSVITKIIRTKPEHIQTKQGHSGDRVKLQANFFKIFVKPNWQLYLYRVDFSHEIAEKSHRRAALVQKIRSFGPYIIHDSSHTMLYLTIKLEEKMTEFVTEGQSVTLTFVDMVSVDTYQYMYVLRQILRKTLRSLDLEPIRQNFYDFAARIDMPEFHLQILPGFTALMRQYESDLLLRIDVTSKVLRKETVFDRLETFRSGRDASYESLVLAEVFGRNLITSYNNKTYFIDNVDFQSNPMSTFTLKNGETTTYVDYYRKKYDITIKHMNQPMLISKASERVRDADCRVSTYALVPELCQLFGLPLEMLDDIRMMQAISPNVCVSPQNRIAKLNALNRTLQQNPASVENLKKWNLNVDKKLVELNGRCLRAEVVKFGNGRQYATNERANWFQNLCMGQMYNSQHLHTWAIIVPAKLVPVAREFFVVLQTAARKMQHNIAQPDLVEIETVSVDEYSKGLDAAAKRIPQLIMCILVSQRVDIYTMIKKRCCLTYAIPSQVLIAKTLAPKSGAPNVLSKIATRVAVQMNTKLGGVPWMIHVPLSSLMVVGLDVCKGRSLDSYGAMVATMDMQIKQKYYSAVSSSSGFHMLSNNFALNIQKAATQFQREHGNLPEKVLIYRAGVAESETDLVYEYEVKVILKALRERYKGKRPLVTFVVVSTKSKTIFFKNGKNPNPGTVVDDVVTLPERCDFYLVSDAVQKGTVRPTYYNILHDEMRLPIDKMQMLAYKLAHLYYNRMATVQVPAVCQYARKLAFFVANYLRECPSNMLQDGLYFL